MERLLALVFLWAWLGSCTAPPTALSETVVIESQEQKIQPAVRILDLDLAAPTAPERIDHRASTPLPEPAAKPSPAVPVVVSPTTSLAAETTATPCRDQAEVVRHLTVRHDTSFRPGQSFTKVWQIQNTGECTWTSDYQWVKVSINPPGGPAFIPLEEILLPGENLDLTINLSAPRLPGNYSFSWILLNGKGEAVELTGVDGPLLLARIVVDKKTAREKVDPGEPPCV